MRKSILFMLVMVASVLFKPMNAQMLEGQDLISALQKGGNVIVMRHAASPMETPAQKDADPGNDKAERQLSADGKESARRMGEAIKRLHIPIGEVLTSPTFRARQSAALAGFSKVETRPQLGENGMSMHAVSPEQTEWLRSYVRHFRQGTNVLLVTHSPNIHAAFAASAKDIKDGEALVFAPDGQGGAKLVARIPIDQWESLR